MTCFSTTSWRLYRRLIMLMNKRFFYIFLTAYIALRVFSFFFSPETPLYGTNPVNSIISAALLLIISYLLIKKNIWGWYLIALELILGGAGGFFAIHGLSLRTLLLIASIGIYKIHLFRDKKIKEFLQTNRNAFIIITLLVIYALFSSVYGYLHGHAANLIVADFIPYLFLFYYFPLKELLANKMFDNSMIWSAVSAAIIGNFLFIAITFVGFSSGIFALQDSYYHWYRDVALGKISELPFHFYRLVLNEHLLLVPVIIYTFYKSLTSKKITHYALLLLPLLAILAVNLTRIYMVALAVGLLALFRISYWKRWLTYAALSAGVFILLFVGVHLSASRGQSLGLELFGLRIQSIAAPSIEDSSLSRMLLLPKIIEKIKATPLLGAGLGDHIKVYSPIFKKEITTPHFDWGYLEIIAEMGLVGLVFWLGLLGLLCVSLRNMARHNTALIKTKQNESNIFSALPWLISSLTALLVINLTSPALFHVLAICWVTLALSHSLSTRSNV